MEKDKRPKLVSVDLGNFVVKTAFDVESLGDELKIAQEEYGDNVTPIFRPRRNSPEPPDMAA